MLPSSGDAPGLSAEHVGAGKLERDVQHASKGQEGIGSTNRPAWPNNIIAGDPIRALWSKSTGVTAFADYYLSTDVVCTADMIGLHGTQGLCQAW